MTPMDAVETAELVRNGSMSPTESVGAAIARAAAINPSINAIVESRDDLAVEEARQTPADGPLAGVPTLLKDLFCPLAGDAAYQGNRLLKELDHRYATTGSVARRLLGAGAVTLGRSHSPELAAGNCPATSETDLYGATRNPWDLSRATLGSSGGAAAAVAAGIVPIAHASDGGGSIRMPASACGVVGLKPSRGRISMAPDGDSWAGGASHGVVTRTVRDTALALDVLAGYEPGDPYVAPPNHRPFLDEVGIDPGRLRVGVYETFPYVTTSPESRVALRAVAALLESLGHDVDDDHPADLDAIDYALDYSTVIAVGEDAVFESLVDVIGRPWTADDMEDGSWATCQRGRTISGTAYASSCERLHHFTRRMVQWWVNGHDLLLTPTLTAPPPPVGYLVEGDAPQRSGRIVEYIAFTMPFNVTGQPAISLPIHWTDDGIPIGVQIVAAPHREDLLLRVAAQLEAAAPWSTRLPTLTS